MNRQMSTDELRRGLSAHLDSTTPPAPDLGTVERIGRRHRQRRTAVVAGAAAATLAVVGLGATHLADGGGNTPDVTDDTSGFATEGQADLSKGLRAFAAPYQRLYLGGTSMPIDDRALPDLDTDAVATAYGIVFYVDGIPTLLHPDGRRTPLLSEVETTEGWHPTAKADAAKPLVAIARMDDPVVVVSVYDLEKGKVVARSELPCEEDCSDLTIEGIDSGVVFVRVPSGVKVWSYADDVWADFAGPDTRIADVRNRVVLYDGAPPTLPLSAWRSVSGAVDSQLTFDGGHVLAWSPRLEAATPGEAPIVLDLPVPATFFTIDTDGSVLAATANDPVRVFDCEVPSGACEEIGTMTAEHGDPLFIGNDM